MEHVILIKSNGEITAEPVSKENFLEDLQRLVGGYLEVMRNCSFMLPENTELVANEEGKLNGYPYNPVATQISGYNIYGAAVIVRRIPGDIAPFGPEKYLRRYVIEPLKYKLAAAIESHE